MTHEFPPPVLGTLHLRFPLVCWTETLWDRVQEVDIRVQGVVLRDKSHAAGLKQALDTEQYNQEHLGKYFL